jgi:catechol 2,3-dioxygenase-like lactoylglutathione lyase family enzyme/predicted enzyme related to lactoylglutathione lyase
MTRLFTVAALLVLVLASPSNATAQLLAAKDGPIVYGHHHLNVTSVDEARKFWVGALGGVVIKFGSADIVKFPNALVFMAARKPSAGSKGSTVDHIGFSVPNLRQVVDRIKAGGFKMVTSAEAPANIQVKDDVGVVEGAGPVSGIAYAMAPDDVKVELVEMKAQTAPIMSHHVHFVGPQKEMQAWYMQTFGAAAGNSANPAAFISANLPGLGMNFTPATAQPAGTQGRAIDHIGFEVKNLEAFTKKLESQGIKLNVAYRQVPQLGIAIAFITDPWGTYIELTEGLDKAN